MMLESRLKNVLIFVAVLGVVTLSCGWGGGADQPELVASATPDPTGNTALTPEGPTPVPVVGYLTRRVTVTDRAGNTAEVPLHLWYPAEGGAEKFTYRTVSDDLKTGEFTSRLSVDGPVATGAAPYHLVLFFHGAFTCGTQFLFLTEHLARRGYIVAAPDFPDALRMCGQWERTDSRLRVLGGLRDIKETGEEEGLAMLEDSFRIPGASAILDELLAWDGDLASPFYAAIDEEKVGLVGHSFGGETILGLIGPHPLGAYHDRRVGAAVILSGPVFPFQDRLGEIEIPVMVMQGDVRDNTDLHRERRREVFQEAGGPAYFLMLEGGVHGSFFNGICPQQGSVEECVKAEPYARVISQYSAAFIDLYLQGDPAAEDILGAADPALRRYLQREDDGQLE